MTIRFDKVKVLDNMTAWAVEATPKSRFIGAHAEVGVIKVITSGGSLFQRKGMVDK